MPYDNIWAVEAKLGFKAKLKYVTLLWKQRARSQGARSIYILIKITGVHMERGKDQQYRTWETRKSNEEELKQVRSY